MNNEKLSQDISSLVNDKMGKELEFLLQASDQKEEERFRQLDETLRRIRKADRLRQRLPRYHFSSAANSDAAGKSCGTVSKTSRFKGK